MFGYLFLAGAVLSSAARGFCAKKTSGYTPSAAAAVFTNIIRLLLSSVAALLFVLVTSDISALIPTPKMLLISLLAGVSTAALLVSWLLAARKSAYMMLDIFLTMGVLLPMVGSSLWFGEQVKLTQWIGFGILLVAVFIMCSYNNTIKAKLTLSSLILLLIAGISNGMADFSQKIFIKLIPDGNIAAFNFYTQLVATIALVITWFVVPKEPETVKKIEFKKIFGFLTVMAISLFTASYFKTLAANELDAALVYPLNQGSSLIISALMAALFFKEKINLKAVIGIILAFIGLLTINVL